MPRKESEQKIFDRYFEGMPVRDAIENLRIFPTDEDIKKAIRKDPRNCVFAKCCERMYGSSAAIFFKSIAYIDLPDENNNRIVNRFQVDQEVSKRIVVFDKTGKAEPGGFLLRAPDNSHTLEHLRKNSKAFQTRMAKKAAILGVSTNTLKRPGTRRKELIHGEIRKGTGQVHFIPSNFKKSSA